MEPTTSQKIKDIAALFLQEVPNIQKLFDEKKLSAEDTLFEILRVLGSASVGIIEVLYDVEQRLTILETKEDTTK